MPGKLGETTSLSCCLVPFITAFALTLGVASLQACGESDEVTASCGDGIVNGEETDVDCGGDCIGCRIGESCIDADDCQSGLCDGGLCAPSQSCTDGRRNGAETDIDCGGGTCEPCLQGQGCGGNGDCAAGSCQAGQCQAPNCFDGLNNGDETGVDCGGSCGACPAGQSCDDETDCVSGVCDAGTCAAPSCTDGIQNGAELDVDCGAGCPGCALDTVCLVDADCESGVCEGRCAAQSCEDGRTNQDETDTDCGGDVCGACEIGEACIDADDCVTVACTMSMCVPPSCMDGVTNGNETDVDCGGLDCPRCGDDLACEDERDCESRVCRQGSCTAATCEDEVRNQDEVDVDCGGATCGGCLVGQFCAADEDCLSNICDLQNLVCLDPSCSDLRVNQDETDVDCGGSTCAPCADNLACLVAADCQSGVCDMNNTCAVPSCTDGVANGSEQGVDCGGPCPAICPDFEDDFESGTLSSDYELSGDADWFASGTSPITGMFSAESGNINDLQNSTMTLEIEIRAPGGAVEFDWEVESESCCDFLEFTIDGTLNLSRAGIQSGFFETQLAPGTYTLAWDYNKDISVSVSGDLGRIDNLVVTNGGLAP